MIGSPKYRYYLLLFGIVLMCALAWKFSIAKTVQLSDRNSELADVGENVDQIKRGIQQALMMKEQLAIRAGSIEVSPEQHRRDLLQTVDSLVQIHQSEVVRFEPMLRYEVEGFEVFLNSITIEGAFHDLLKICQHLDFHASNGKLVNVHFKRVKNRSTRKNELHATYTIQSLRAGL